MTVQFIKNAVFVSTLRRKKAKELGSVSSHSYEMFTGAPSTMVGGKLRVRAFVRGRIARSKPVMRALMFSKLRRCEVERIGTDR